VRNLHSALCNPTDDLWLAIRDTIPFPDDKIPSRRTFDRRLKGFQLSAQIYMQVATQYAVEEFRLGIARLALDNRMFEACGAIWHRKHQKLNIIPKGLRNVDRTAGWGISKYRGWVFGHGLDVFVTTGKCVWPVLAVGRSLKKKGNTVVKSIVQMLPKVKKGVVSADSEYEDQVLARCLSFTGRSLHTPSKRDPSNVPSSETYRRRKFTVEPFYERFLMAFNARGKLTRKGKAAHSCLVICCFVYQLMVLHNLLEGKCNPMEVTHLIHML